MKTIEKLPRNKTLVKPSRNKTLENVLRILDGEFPEEYILIRTKKSTVDIYSSSDESLRIPVESIDEFIFEIKKRSVEPKILYRFGENNQLELLGEKIPELIKYLREAKKRCLRKAKVHGTQYNYDRYF